MTVAVAGTPEMTVLVMDALHSSALTVICEVPSADAILGACQEMSPDVAVVGLADGSRAWRDRIAALKAELDGSAVVAIMAEDGRVNARRLCSAGVDGVVRQDDLARALVPTINAVTVGQLTVPLEVGRAIAPPTFSTREKQVLALIVMGLTNGQIAAKLWLAESTVKSHLASAFNKLGVRSRSEAAALILDPEQGLATGILALNEALPSFPDAIAS